MCFPLCRDIPLLTLICYLPNAVLWTIRFCGRSLRCPPGPAPGQPDFFTVIVGPLQWDMLTSVYQENYAWTFVKTCRSVSGGQPEYQLCFASRRRNGCALLRDSAACFCSAGLSLRPAFTTFNFRHLPGASLRCPKLLLQDYGHETVSGAVNTACWRTDDAALCCIQKSPGMSPAPQPLCPVCLSQESSEAPKPGSLQARGEIIPDKHQSRDLLPFSKPQAPSPALGWLAQESCCFNLPSPEGIPSWAGGWATHSIGRQLKVGGPCHPRSWSTMTTFTGGPSFQGKWCISLPGLPHVALIIIAGAALRPAMLVSHKN